VGARENMCELPLTISMDGERQPSYTTLLRTCAYGVVLETSVASPERVRLSSEYLGDSDRSARSTHFSDAPDHVPLHTGWRSVDHPCDVIDVRWAPRHCLYDHLQRLLDLLEHLGHTAAIDVRDEALRPFEALARGRTVAAGRPEMRELRSDLAAVLDAWRPFGAAGERHGQA
jgi:hypothetical protein